MALIQCKDCGKEVSSGARRCPHCGYAVQTGGVWAMAIVIIIIFGLIMIGVVVRAQAEEYFTWTDEDGVAHIGNAPVEPPQKGKVNVREYQESTPEQRDHERQVQERKYRAQNARSERAQERERDREESRREAAIRKKEWYAERCENARKNEKTYRNEWRNARSQYMTDYWKRQLDDIEDICRKAQ